jgi:hypothetical protein
VTADATREAPFGPLTERYDQVMGTLLVRIARLAFAALGIAAIVSAVTATTGSLGNFFSYFTIESNMLAIVVLIVGGLLNPQSRDWAYLRGAATLFMVITGIVYAALLANAEVGLTTAWIDDTLHRVIPLVMLADWVFFPPWARRSFLAALGWLAGPLAYFAYSLARGPVVRWYPYPFLDPRHPGGYGRVALYAVVLAVAMGLLGRRRQRHRPPSRRGARPPPGDVAILKSRPGADAQPTRVRDTAEIRDG